MRSLLLAAALVALPASARPGALRLPAPAGATVSPSTSSPSPRVAPLVRRDTQPEVGSAILVHPDGTGVAHWGAGRLVTVGPDGDMAWDRLERIGVYRGHQANSLASSSNAGATAHAWGVKVPYESFGTDGAEPLTALSGQRLSVLQEASRAGLSTALINSGHIAEPGTAVFGASAPSRADIEGITLGLLETRVDIIMGGGEVLLLPAGTVGRFGQAGVRRDGRNLIRMARDLGYTVVYSREELMRLPDRTDRVLGVFAAGHTFNARPEDALRALDQPLYQPDAPTIGEMTAKTLRMLAARESRFLLVVEEEGTDNFANVNNAAGTLEALRRADGALAAALAFVDRNPRTLLLTAADSDAGGMEVWAVRDSAEFDLPLPVHTRNGAPLDGQTGAGGIPFVAEPDAAGRRLRFGVAWVGFDDVMGGIVARAHGLNADWLPPSVDNTDIYRMLYATLFGVWLP